MDQEVSIRIRSSFQVEGAEEAQAATEGLREEFRALAEAVEEAANRLGERFPQAVQRLAEPPPRVEEKVPPSQVVERLELEALTPRQGELYVDVARRALEAGELDRAGQALYRAAQAGEPEHLIRRLGAELLLARRAQARVEEDEENPQAEHLRRRVEAMLPTLAAQIASGRLVQAERGLAGAEAYLEQVRALEGNTEELRRLEEALKGHKATLEEAKKAQEAQAQGRGVDARGALEEVGEMALGRALGGAGTLGSLAARLSRFLGPWGWLALGAGAAVGAVEVAGGMAREGRQEAMAFLELNRALGLDYPTWVGFLDVARGRPFATRAELEALFYTARDAGRFAAAYGLIAPEAGRTQAERVEGLFQDVLSGLRLARYLGVDEDRVAGLLRTGVQAGVVLPGQAEGLAGILFRAVREGTREGVSTAETLQSMERHLQALLAQGITGSERTLAAYAALVDRLNETQNRALMGEAGARALGNLVEGLTRTGVPGLEVLTLRAIGLPAARELGLTGAEAREYEALRRTAPLLAGRFLLEEARGFNPEVLRRLGAGLGAAFQGRPDLEYLLATEYLGLSFEQLAAIRGRYGSLFAFLQQAQPAELRRYLEARPEDVATGGVARQLAEAGYRREYLEEEISRLKSLAAAQQDLDVGLRELARSAAEASNTLAALAGGIAQDPVFGPLLQGSRQATGVEPGPLEGLPVLGPAIAALKRVPWLGGLVDFAEGVARAFTPRPQTPPPPSPPQGPVSVEGLEARARRDAAVNQVLRGLNVQQITLGVGVPYARSLREQYPRLPPVHQGVDLRIGAIGPGDPVRSPFAGQVARVGYDPGGYGNYVVLRAGEHEVLMAHLQEVRVKPGQTVRPGNLIGLEGETGAAKGAHLHLELRRGGKAITDQEAFWESLARLTAPPPPKEEKPATGSIQVGGTLTVNVHGLPPEVGARVGKRIEQVVQEEMGRHGQETRSPYNEGARRGSFR